MSVSYFAGVGNSEFNVANGALQFSNGTDNEASFLFQYDGIDPDGGSLTLDATGLGGVDLTDGDRLVGLQFDLGSDSPVTGGLEILIYTDASNVSFTLLDLTDTAGHLLPSSCRSLISQF